MKLEDALQKLNSFLSKVQATENLDGLKEFYMEFEEINTISDDFSGKDLKIIRKKLNTISKAIEKLFLNVMTLFLQKFQETDSLESVQGLLLEYRDINDWANKFQISSREKIKQLRSGIRLVVENKLLGFISANTPEIPDPSEIPQPGFEEPKPAEQKLNEPESRKINQTRAFELVYIRKNIEILQRKIKELQENGYTLASFAANQLCEAITTYAAQYECEDIDLETFKLKANEAIDLSHKELDKPRGYRMKHILANLAFAVLTLGIGYLIAAAYKGTFFPISPNTDSANKVDVLAAAVNEMVAVN